MEPRNPILTRFSSGVRGLEVWELLYASLAHIISFFGEIQEDQSQSKGIQVSFPNPWFYGFLILARMEVQRQFKKTKKPKKKLLCVLEAQSYYFVSSSMSSDPSDKLASQTQVQECQRGLFNSNLLLGLLNSNFDFWSFPKELGQIELIKFSRLLWFPSSCTDLAPVILNFWAFIFVKKIG